MAYDRIPQIGIIMSSEKDLPQMERAALLLQELGIPFEMTSLSPYGTPDEVRQYGASASRRGYEVILAGSGGSQELALMVASYTCLPVIGIPLRTREDQDHNESPDGQFFNQDFKTMLSALDTPLGVPLASVGFNEVENAALLAAQILGVKDRRVRRILERCRETTRQMVLERATRIEARGRELQPAGIPDLTGNGASPYGKILTAR